MSKKVLIVDDARVVRMALARIMKKLGFETIKAGDGQQALEQMKANPDTALILLDWHMPVMNGYDFLLILRSMPAHTSSPVVVMVTTEANMPSMLKALAAGADEYVMKPFDIDLIKDKMDIIGLEYKD